MADSLVSEMLRDIPWFGVAFFFVIGSFVGSFLNVVVYRLPRNCLSINNPRRSFCPSCKTQLKAVDNIPVVGWAILRGKCRYCRAKFSVRYALVELLTATLFAYTFWRIFIADGQSADVLASWVMFAHILLMISVLVPWALIDLDMQIIPNSLTFGPLLVFIPLSANSLTYTWGLANETSGPRLGRVAYDPLIFDFVGAAWLNSMLSALLTGFAAMAFLFIAGKVGNIIFRKQVQKIGGESMGGADINIMLMMGVMLGWPKMVAAFFVAILVGAVLGLAARLRRGSLGVPFGPFLAVGAVSTILFAADFRLVVDAYFEWLEKLAT